jgi:predicted TIM-barrel fold metal-dependent hydrolase
LNLSRWLAPALCAAAAFTAVPVRAAQGGAATYYSMQDFQHVDKIDAHVHIHGPANAFMAQALHDNFRILTINVDYPDYPPIAAQQQAAVSLLHRFPGRVAFVATFPVSAFTEAGWTERALASIQVALREGAVGVKIWKNIGMELKDADGRYVMPDDPRFEPIFSLLEREHVVLLGHQAEPLNCWLPLTQMTVRSDREYFTAHPQYYMYQHPEMPSHETILAARDRLLARHPAMRFDAVHLASLEWDVDEVARFLDRFPDARVDVAARLVHLEYQSARDLAKVRRFLVRYQDRILYGSDDDYGPRDPEAAAVKEIDEGWRSDWRFLVTQDVLHSREFAGSFRGLHLPRSVIDKIYRRNAMALFPGAWTASK